MRSVVDRNVVMRRILVNQDTDTDVFKLVCDVSRSLIVSRCNVVSASGRYRYNGLIQKHIHMSAE